MTRLTTLWIVWMFLVAGISYAAPQEEATAIRTVLFFNNGGLYV